MKFVGARLKLGRAFRDVGQSALAKRIAVTPGHLSQIESDRKEPSMLVVAAIADELGFAPEFFYRPIKDAFTEKECSFRRLAATPMKTRDRVLAHGTLVSELVHVLGQHVRFPEYGVPQVPVRTSEDVERAAEYCRERWQFGMGPIQNMTRVLERAGVIVVKIHDSSDAVDAFARNGPIKIVVANDAKACPSRARMDLSHELGHLVMHSGLAGPEEEDQAKQFGGAFLMPRGSFGRYFRAAPRIDWPTLFQMKEHWGVTVSAIITRARELHLIGDAQYIRLVKHMRYRGWHKGEPAEPLPELPEMLGDAVRVVNARGKKTTEQLIRELGWSDEVYEKVTGIAAGPEDEMVVKFSSLRLA